MPPLSTQSKPDPLTSKSIVKPDPLRTESPKQPSGQADAKPSRLTNARGGRKNSLDRSQTKISSYFELKPTTNKSPKVEDQPKENIRRKEAEQVRDTLNSNEQLSKTEVVKTDAESEICIDAGKANEEPGPNHQRKVEPEKEKRAVTELIQNVRRSGRRSEIER